MLKKLKKLLINWKQLLKMHLMPLQVKLKKMLKKLLLKLKKSMPFPLRLKQL